MYASRALVAREEMTTGSKEKLAFFARISRSEPGPFFFALLLIAIFQELKGWSLVTEYKRLRVHAPYVIPPLRGAP